MGIAATENLTPSSESAFPDENTGVEASLARLALHSDKKAAPAPVVPAAPRAPAVVHAFAAATLVSPTRVEVAFADGTRWLFHSTWLLDSCRSQLDQGFNRNAVVSAVTAHFFNGGVDKHTNALSVAVSGDGDTLEVNFGSDCSESFTASFLRAYAPIVGKAVDGEQPVYFTRNPLSAQHDDKLWDSTLDLPTFQYRDLIEDGPEYERYCHAVVAPGVAVVQGMPADDDATGKPVSDAMFKWFGKMMQHPERDTNHWLISSMGYTGGGNTQGYALDRVEQNPAYNTKLRLLNHTDQVSYGAPGFLLAFHCVAGQGTNTVCDGFKVAEIMRTEYPEYFKALCTPTSFGRRISHYSNPIDQHVLEPIFTLDSYGKVLRVRFNEILRGPVALPFDDFETYYSALKKFVELVNSDALQIERVLQKGEMIVFNNWRAMHGRKTAGANRIIVGGTVALESFKSKMRLVFDKYADVKTMKDRIGVPEAVLAQMLDRPELQCIR